MDIIISHAHCPDGFCAAFIAKKKYPEAEVIFLDHGADHTAVLEKCIKRDVLMLDFSLRTREENDALAASTRSFCILDHHKSAKEVLEGAPYAIFDMSRSGAGLTWDELFGGTRPWVVDFIEDRDLWNWRLHRSKQICAYLGTLPFTFEAWSKLDWSVSSNGESL
jgi:oligoribonuclease NrnB/cAMP/cGMP phosphodiesterase (DHH superfamily)